MTLSYLRAVLAWLVRIRFAEPDALVLAPARRPAAGARPDPRGPFFGTRS